VDDDTFSDLLKNLVKSDLVCKRNEAYSSPIPSYFVHSGAASSSHASGRARDNDLNSSTFLNAAGPEERTLFELSNLPGTMNPVHQFAQEIFFHLFLKYSEKSED
jgi:hypothetical protein